ncbi:hypothetical protein [Lysobacter sp. P5_B9]
MVLKYFDTAFECFSAWTADELRSFSGLITQLKSLTWEQLYKHNGLRPKEIDVKTVTDGAEALKRVRSALSPDISFLELRASRGLRLHGFRVEDAFFLVLLDREHRVYRE